MLYRGIRTFQRLARLITVSTLCAVGISAGAQPNGTNGLIIKLIPGVRIADVANAYGLSVVDGVTGRQVYQVTSTSPGLLALAAANLAYDLRVQYSQIANTVQVTEVDADPFQLAFDEGSSSAGYTNQTAFQQVNLPTITVHPGDPSVLVAILDTGVDFHHPALAGKLAPGINLINFGTPPADVQDGVTNNAFGHGTMVTGIVTRVSPHSVIFPVRILNGDGTGTILNVIRGVYVAILNGADVINMSFGTSGYSPALEDALDEAALAGVVTISAAGNSGSNTPLYPAAYNTTIGVGALNADNTIASFSSYGSANVSVMAPGVGIRSTYPGGGYASWSGTSFAAPFVTGEAAELVAEHPLWGPSLIGYRISTTSVDIDPLNPGLGGNLGSGIINIQAALRRSY